jgi:hypothetical protein
MEVTVSDIEKLAREIRLASADYESARTPITPGVYSFAELPEQTAEEIAAYRKMTELGRRIFRDGGDGLMERTYDLAVARYGQKGVKGIRFAWSGIGGWQA